MLSNLSKGASFIILWLISLSMLAQSITVRGTVSDERGEPFPGVAITIVGSTREVIFDIDSNFPMDVGASDKLLFSFE